SGLADDSRAILPETHGVVAAVAAEDLSLRHQDADGQAVGGVEEVAVDARHHP
ncbi:Chorion class high-cysteine HCB protein 13, partial [Dysosmobacter welbionis]